MKRIIAIALLSAAIASPALAQQRESHWYGALDAGTLNMQNSPYASPGSMTISGGYRMNRNLALEAGVTAIGDSTLYGSGTSRTARQGDIRFLAVGILPVSQNIELFGKAGIGFHSARITNNLNGSYNQYTTGNAILGFGGQFNFNTRFGLRLQYEHLGKSKATDTDTGADISRVSIGGVLNF
ncbi:MAG: porin family protein [Hylemonella sp.]|nr:porin family protein [Hylemonella sp.]